MVFRIRYYYIVLVVDAEMLRPVEVSFNGAGAGRSFLRSGTDKRSDFAFSINNTKRIAAAFENIDILS